MTEIKLTKAEVALYESWQREMNAVIQSVGNIANELLNRKVEQMARDKGIDLEDGDWKFLVNPLRFIKEEAKKVIPSAKNKKKKTNKKVN